MHIFFWCNYVSSVSDLDKRNELLAFIDTAISTSIPDATVYPYIAALVLLLQTRRHTPYCHHSSRGCRFGFPFSPCSKTRICLSGAYTHCHKDKPYETKRTEKDCYINAFNPVILDFWHANMDIQMVGTAESAAFYVCAYLCKSEPDDLNLH